MREAAAGVHQGRRLGRVLLRLNHEPAAVIRRLERGERCGEIDRTVARHGKDAVEHGVEKALIRGTSACQHSWPDILAVDMVDSPSMPPCDIGRVGAGKSQVAGVEQQTDAAAGRRHKTVDFGRGLDHRPHVVVIGKAEAPFRQAVGQLGEADAEIAPVSTG
jgi:hypothetical protein